MDDPTLLIGAAVGVLVLAGGAFYFLRSRKTTEEPILHFNCPSCKRRLRYKGRQAGHKGACPRCREQFTFPLTPSAK